MDNIENQLTGWEKRMIALGDLLPEMREEILFGGGLHKNSLTNGTDSAIGPTLDRTESESGLHIDGPACLLETAETGWRQDQLRDIMDSTLRKEFPGVKWSSSPNIFIEMHKAASIPVFRIGDSHFRPYRVYNFEHCYAPRTHGSVLTSVDDPTQKYRQRFRCGEAACLDCRDRDRTRLAAEKIAIFERIVAANPGCPCFFELVPSLPEEAEHIPFKHPEVGLRLLDAAHTLFRDMFGAGSRANIPACVGVHPVGAGDPYRDRWHSHIEGLPARIVEDPNTGKKRFEWLELRHTAQGHKKNAWKIDLAWLRKRWNDLIQPILRPYLGPELKEAIPPEVTFVSGEAKDFLRTMSNKIRYALRGWGRNFEEAVLCASPRESLIILKGRRGDTRYWVVSPAEDYAVRWKWLRDNNRVTSWGFLQRAEMHADVLGIAPEDPDDGPPDVVRADAEVAIVREKRYNAKRRRVVWIRDEFYSWSCPVTGKRLRASKGELSPWRWAWPRGLPGS